MCTSTNNIDLGFTDESFPSGTHMCLIYSNEEERIDVIARFLDSGLKTCERVAYFSDEASADEVKAWLIEKGIEIPKGKDSKQFSISSTALTYHPNGKFVPEEMLETLKAFYNNACNENYPNTRVSGEMSWALKGIPGSERLMEYESKVNEVFITHPVTAICQYDANKFDGATILECLKVHPFMIVRGQIVRNPYYLKPDEYLKQLSTS